jgi:hypothetical protein
MIFLTLLCALALSGIAAYYSVVGLAAIFTGAFWPIVFMGSVLEASKLVTTSWLYRNWKDCPFLLKSYLTTAVVILMLITSMGIFGFLSKAHIDSTLNAGANNVEVKTLNIQEKIAKERLDYLLARAKDPSTASNRLDKQIQDTQKELADINKKKLPLLKESNKLVAEVGPIKYVGDMVYGTDDDNAIDKAVRLVIMLIMVVFDPLAVLLLIAANMSIKQKEGTLIVKHKEIVGLTPSDIPVFVPKKEPEMPEEDNKVKVDKENIAEIKEEPVEPIKIPEPVDPFTGQTIKRVEVHAPGIYTEHHEVVEESPKKKLEPKYDYNAEFAFKEKNVDGGDF